MNAIDMLLSFGFTWAVILLPPIALRALRRKPFTKWPAVFTSAGLCFADLVIFIASGSQSKSHLVVYLGAFAAYHVLRYKRKMAIADQRKNLGYE